MQTLLVVCIQRCQSNNAQLVKAFTTGVNSDLPSLPSFWGKMSLSLSNSLSFALIPLVKIGKNCKKSYFFVLEVSFHHEGGLSGSRYLELFFSTCSIFSPCQKLASAEAPFNLFWTLTIILAKLSFQQCGENNLVQNLGRDHPKKCKISCLVGLLNEKQGSSFAHFLYFSNPIDPLNL